MLLSGLVLWVSGCGLGPADASPPTLLTVSGTVSTGGQGPWQPKNTPHVVVGWFVSPSGDGSTAPWILGEKTTIAPDASGAYTRWTLDLSQAPPPEAFVDAPDMAGGTGRIAYGFLTLFEGAVPANWPSDDDSFGGSNHILVYWSGKAPAAFEDGMIQPGYQLVAVSDPADPYDERQVTPLAEGVDVQLGVDPSWQPSYTRCSYELAYPSVEIFPGNDGYPAVHPPYGDVSCRLCGEHYEDTFCAHVLEHLCTECVQARVWVDAEEPSAAWPCQHAGQTCDPEEDSEPACFLGDRFSCQGGTWVLTHRCDPSADGCCEDACVPVP